MSVGQAICLLTGLALLSMAGCKQTLAPSAPPATSADAAVDQEGDYSPLDEYEPPPVPDQKVGERPDPSTDEAGLWLMADRIEEDLRFAGNRVTDPALNAYVKGVACRVAGPYCPDIRVYILRVAHFNATMVPNGVMTVWTGFLLRARNEAQLAAVLGHEIGHYVRRHSIQRWRSVVNTTGFLQFFGMAMAGAGIPAAGNMAALFALGGLNSFSRDAEREADAIGADWMARAGYDPREAAKVWQNLIEEYERAGEDRDFSFFLSSHPRDAERQETLTELAKALVAKAGDSGDIGTARYREVIRPHRYAMLRDEIRLRDYKRNLALLDMFIEEGVALGELYFFKGEVHRLRDQEAEKDRSKALAAYEKAQTFDEYPVGVFRSLGLLQNRMGNREKAVQAIEKYLELRPDAPDAALLKLVVTPTG